MEKKKETQNENVIAIFPSAILHSNRVRGQMRDAMVEENVRTNGCDTHHRNLHLGRGSGARTESRNTLSLGTFTYCVYTINFNYFFHLVKSFQSCNRGQKIRAEM